MGNCQAVDAAALVIQHPNGKQERMYRPVAASEVMKMNPGHYVSLIIPLPNNIGDENNSVDNNYNNKSTVRFSKVKLLRASETLVLGRAYRLVTTQEVMIVIRPKKHAKLKKNQSVLVGENLMQSTRSEAENNIDQDIIRASDDRHNERSGSTNLASGRFSKSWRPSLISISESGS